MTTGLLVAVEGGPGAATRAQSRLLCDALAAAGVAAHLAEGDQSWLQDETLQSVERRPYPGRLVPLLCRLAWVADVACRQIGPLVEMGQVVVVDRYRYTLLAHVAARGLDVRWAEDLMQPLPQASVSLYLSSPPERQMARLFAHSEPLEGWEAGTDAVRSASLSGAFRSYQTRVAHAFDDFCRRGELAALDGEEQEAALARRVLDRVLATLGGKRVSIERLDFEQALLRFAGKYAFDEPHARQVARLAGQLAERLAPIHDLDEADRVLLRHAALVHDVGYFIAGRRHHRHTEYMIRYDESLQDYPAALRERLALLARSHRKRLPDLPKRWSRQVCDRFRQAAALLRLADGLDYAHDGAGGITACHIGRQTVVVEVDGVDLPEIERVLRRKAVLFATAFDRDVAFSPAGSTVPRPSR